MEKIFTNLTKRLGQSHLRKRLTRQVDLATKFYAQGGYSSFHIENFRHMYHTLKFLLKVTCLYNRGLQNAIKYEVEKVKVQFDNLPPQFRGFRILQLSDIHADAIMDNGDALCRLLAIIELTYVSLPVTFGSIPRMFMKKP